MLDSVSLRSEYYRDVFQIFYELYMMTADFENRLSLRPTSVFIVRSCLGWLFDQPNAPNEYYSYRQMRNPINPLLPIPQNQHTSELTAVKIFVPNTVSEFFEGNQRILLNADYKHDENQLSGTFEKLNENRILPINRQHTEVNKTVTDLALKKFDPLLESVLYAACPFLADFRVSIMPRRNSKVVSRTGRLRHITPKIATPTTTSTIRESTVTVTTSPTIIKKSTQPARTSDDDTQTKLVDAFLHSQSLSVRRTVEFVQERVYSAVVKDFQVEILIPFKKTIVETIDKIQLNDSQAILEELYRIYANGEKALLGKWQDFVTPAALERVKVNIIMLVCSFSSSLKPN